jgi:hypothetical protein
MYLIHKALRAEVERGKRAVDGLETGGSFKPFQQAFYRWVIALGYHADVEDRYVTACLEELVLPLIRARLSTEQQQEIARHLLAGPQAQDAPWSLDWVLHHVTSPGTALAWEALSA